MIRTVIMMDEEDVRIWSLMQALKQLDAFNIVYGKLIIDFDGQKKISNVKIEKNYRITDLITPVKIN